jgi:hypothetical protein
MMYPLGIPDTGGRRRQVDVQLGHRAASARTGCLVLATLFVSVIAMGSGSSEAQALERPNVLIIMTDDQNPGRDGLSVMDALQRIYRQGVGGRLP